MSPAARALLHAFESGAIARERAFFLRAEPLPFEDIDAEQSLRSTFLELERATPRICDGGYPQGLVRLTRYKEENYANIARGWHLLRYGGTLVCAGANADGALSLEKQADKVFGLAGSLSKFHCRVFWLRREEREPPAYWEGLARPQPVSDGSWLSQPGIFAWDDVDAGSALLARHLPSDLAGEIADFGCGWGYLSRRILNSDAPVALDLIDAEYRALEAAMANIDDDRAGFHWLDLAREAAPGQYDAIVCNPPFHVGRAAEPALGQAIIAAAARALRPGGRLFMVANRGLPYQACLEAEFASFQTLADNNKFRVSVAVR